MYCCCCYSSSCCCLHWRLNIFKRKLLCFDLEIGLWSAKMDWWVKSLSLIVWFSNFDTCVALQNGISIWVSFISPWIVNCVNGFGSGSKATDKWTWTITGTTFVICHFHFNSAICWYFYYFFGNCFVVVVGQWAPRVSLKFELYAELKYSRNGLNCCSQQGSTFSFRIVEYETTWNNIIIESKRSFPFLGARHPKIYIIISAHKYGCAPQKRNISSNLMYLFA